MHNYFVGHNKSLNKQADKNSDCLLSRNRGYGTNPDNTDHKMTQELNREKYGQTLNVTGVQLPILKAYVREWQDSVKL